MTIYIMAHKDCEVPVGLDYAVVGLGGFKHPSSDHVDTQVTGRKYPNDHYCELTGINYLLQNSTQGIVGVCHYRRYFNLLPLTVAGKVLHGNFQMPMGDQLNSILSSPAQFDTIANLLKHYDIILPRAAYSINDIGFDYCQAHGEREWNAFLENLDEYYGEYQHSIRVEKRNFLGNMFIAPRKIFHHYGTQLFNIIDGVYNRIGVPQGISGARYQPYRYPGYLGERFMSAFINANKLKYFEADIVVTEI